MDAPQGAEQGEASLALRDYLSVVWRRKWVVLVSLVVFTAAAVAMSVQQEAVYEASAKVLLSRENLASRLTGVPESSASSENEVFVKTQASVARIPEIANDVIHRLHLNGMTAKEFLGESSVSSSPESELLTFNVKSNDREEASRSATAYAEAYSRYREKQDTASFKAAQKGVEGRLNELRAAGEDHSTFYTSLQNKEQQLQTLATLQTANTTVVERSTEATQVAPRPLRNGALGLVVGLVVGLGLAFLLEALDTRVRTTEDLERLIALPLLGRVPKFSKPVDAGTQPMISDPLGHAAEAYRLLRTNIEFMTIDSKAKSILVTSALEQEGKTTTIVNLAVAFAQTGKSVILVDLDLRRPRIHQFLQTAQAPGLTDLLKDPSRLDEVLTDFDDRRVFGDSDLGDSRGRLQVLSSGFIPPNPGDLVASPRLSELLGQLSLRADLVLIDSPPMLQVGDAAAAASSVDAIFIVARMPKLRRRMLTEVKRMLATIRAQHLGVVATAVDQGDDYGYGYGYGYGRGAAAGDPRENGGPTAAPSDRVRTSAPE